MERFKNRENLIIAIIVFAIIAYYWVNKQEDVPMTLVSTAQTETTITETKEVVVHITGRVKKPGVYTLTNDARLLDVVEAAGGLYPDADESQINLSQKITDEQRIHISAKGEVAESLPVQAEDGRIDINHATKEELETLPGIGPALAERIIAHREQQLFVTIEDITNVSGIGEKLFEGMKELIVVR